MGTIAGLYYEEHGPSDAPPIILSAGLGGSAVYWRPNLAALAERHRVILYDHRGTGRSDRALPPDVDVEQMAEDVLAVMDGLGLASATMIGHAAGGIIGLAIALAAPERLDRLVVVNGFARPDRHFFRCMDVRSALLRDSGVIDFVRAQPIFLYPARWISANSDRLDAEENELVTQFQGRANFEARVNALCALGFEGSLGGIGVPTLLIAAEDDMLVTPSQSERLAAAIPGATLAMMQGGHACNVTKPEAFNEILLAWLAGAPTQGGE